MNQLHFIPVDLGSPIVQCAVADPYVVIMSAEGQVTMFLLKSDSYGGRHHRLALHKPPLHHVGFPPPPPGRWVPAPPAPASPLSLRLLPPQQSKVITLCVYRDVSGMFTTESRLGGTRDEPGGRSGSDAEGQGSETRCVQGQVAGGWGPCDWPPVTCLPAQPHCGRRGGDAVWGLRLPLQPQQGGGPQEQPAPRRPGPHALPCRAHPLVPAGAGERNPGGRRCPVYPSTPCPTFPPRHPC